MERESAQNRILFQLLLITHYSCGTNTRGFIPNFSFRQFRYSSEIELLHVRNLNNIPCPGVHYFNFAASWSLATTLVHANLI